MAHYSVYLKICTFVAKPTNSDACKARSTIILHGIQLLMCMLTFVGPFLDRLLAEMFPLFITDMRFSSYLVIQIMPRFISPVVYGMRDQTFCKYLKRYLLCTMFKMRRKIQTLQPSGNLAKVSNKSMWMFTILKCCEGNVDFVSNICGWIWFVWNII